MHDLGMDILEPMPDKQIFHIYCDESSQGSHHYMAIGATFCRRDAAKEIADTLTNCVVNNGGREGKELRWNDLTRQTLPMYRAAGAAFLKFTKHGNRKLRYRALVVDNHRVRGGEERDVILSKFIFTIVFHFAQSFGPNINYHVFLDERSSADTLDRTLYSLNNKVKTRFSVDTRPFRTVKFVPSNQSRLIQGTDLATGAIAYETNERHLKENAAAHRLDLLRYITETAGLDTLARPTSRWPFTFQIGHFDFEKSRLRS